MPELRGGNARASVAPARIVERPKTLDAGARSVIREISRRRLTEQQMLANAQHALSLVGEH